MSKCKNQMTWRRYIWVKGAQEMVFSLLSEGQEDLSKIRAHFPKVWENRAFQGESLYQRAES